MTTDKQHHGNRPACVGMEEAAAIFGWRRGSESNHRPAWKSFEFLHLQSHLTVVVCQCGAL